MNTNQRTRLFIYYFIFISIEIICETSTFEEELLKLTYEIVRKYFKHYRCITYITANLESPTFLKLEQPVMSIDLTDDFSQDEVLIQSYEQGCGGYVIRTTTEMKEDVIRGLISAYGNSTNFRYNKQRYLYLPYDEKDEEVKVLELPEMYFMPNLLMITAKSEDYFNFSIIAHNYFHGHKYDVLNVKHEAIESWTSSRGFATKSELYWDKIKNLNGKKIILAMVHFPLYAIVVNESDKIIFDGLETRISATFVELSNGTWEGINHPEHLWGEIKNGSADGGIFGSVMSRGADMGFSAIYQWYCDVLDCSYPYVYAGVTCMVPRPQKLPGWLTVVLPFTPRTWYCLISAYLVSTTFVFFISIFIQRMKEKTNILYGYIMFESFFKTFRLQLVQIPKDTHSKTSLAVYLKWLVVYYFFVAVCWSGEIASILTVPRYEPPINTVVDLTSRYPKMEWGANSIDWTISIKQTSEPLLRQIVDEFVVAEDDVMKRRTRTRDFAFFVERLPHGHYGMNDYIDEESLKYLKIMEDNIYTANAVTVLPKGSPYRERLDMAIFNMFDTGLLQKMEIQVSLERINNRLQNLIKSSNEKPARKVSTLHIGQIQGAIFIYMGGVSISITIFLIELSYRRIKTTWHNK